MFNGVGTVTYVLMVLEQYRMFNSVGTVPYV